MTHNAELRGEPLAASPAKDERPSWPCYKPEVPMKKTDLFVIRMALNAALLYGVYTETGPITTLAICLTLVFSELVAGYIKRQTK